MYLVILSHRQAGKWLPNSKKKKERKKERKKKREKKGVTGRIFHGKPTERNHCELNHVLIQLNHRKTPSKIFKLASKQQQHNNKSLVY